MDEVDKIIIHSLKQIGCKVELDDESESFGLQHFTPELLVKAVSKCLQAIKTEAEIPKILPENMAQRFTVATYLAEMCSDCGYRGDIGYQTFLYPNVVDIRRLFMFLIEQLPKEQISSLDDSQQEHKDDFDLLMGDVRSKILQQLKSPWVPQYCCGIANRKSLGCTGISVEFLPQLNLNIPESETKQTNEQSSMVTYQIPNIFQQTSMGDYDLVSSVLHKNSMDVYTSKLQYVEDARLILARSLPPIPPTVKISVKGIKNKEPEETNLHLIKSPLEKLTTEVESLKLENDQNLKERQTTNTKLNQLRQERSEIEKKVEDLKKESKIHERTSVILENPEENLNRLESLIEKTRDRRLAVESQWQLHRNSALEQIEALKKLRQSKNLQSIHELWSTIQQLEASLVAKTNSHAQLADELKKTSSDAASRQEYTLRIYEFISNIRKQRNDIYKILDDTKDLQKQLNSVSAQLHRQFNYTDDLLFQSAKHDLHAKQAYKLLATLHTSCKEICDMVSRSGQLTKETRDLEVQIDRERMHNVTSSLKKITLDIQQFENIIRTMKADINQVENEIVYSD